MLNVMQAKAVALRIAVVGYVVGAVGGDNKERGQASAEYAGIIFVIVAIIAALVALSFTGLGEAIIDKITQAIGKIGS